MTTITRITELYQFIKKEQESPKQSFKYSDQELKDSHAFADAIIQDMNDRDIEYDKSLNPIDIEDAYSLEDFGLDEKELSKAEDEQQNIATKTPVSGGFISPQTPIPENAVYVKDQPAPKGTPTFKGPQGGVYWIESVEEGAALGSHGDKDVQATIQKWRKFITNDGKKRGKRVNFKPKHEPAGGELDLTKHLAYKVEFTKGVKPEDIPWEIVLNASAGTSPTGKYRSIIPKTATHVWISTDSRAPVQAMYKTKGSDVINKVFTPEYAHQADVKNYANHKKDIPKIREIASNLEKKPLSDLTEEEKVISLASHLPIRHGGEKDSGKKGVGLISLRKKHIQIIGDTARLDFMGKGNIPQSYNTSDPRMVELIKNNLEGKGDEDRLFEATVARDNSYLKNTSASETIHLHNFRHGAATRAAEKSVEEFNKAGESMTLAEAQKIIGKSAAELLGHKKKTGSGEYETDTSSTWSNYIHPEVIHGVHPNLITDWDDSINKSWITNPRGSLDSKRKGKIYKEDGGGFGDGGGTVFTSTNSGIFSPTYGNTGKKNKKKRTGIERLGSFVSNKSPEKKMVKSTTFTLDLVDWVKDALLKDEAKFRQQTSGEDINPQTKEIEGRRNPVEFDAEPDKNAAIEQKDMERKIRNLDDDEDIKGNKPDEKGDASQVAPAGLEIQLTDWGSGSEKGPLVTGGYKDKKKGKIAELEDETKERSFR